MQPTTLCYIEKDGKYLMLHRVKKEHDLNEGKWIGVGGKIESGETADEGVIREVYEETGLTLTKFERVGLVKFISDEYEAEDMYLYKGLETTGDLTENCPEGILQWVPIEQVPGLPTWEGDKYFLQAMLEGRHNLNMTLRYEKDRLVEVIDRREEVCVEKASLISCPHGFSTRLGGVSEGIYESLNLSQTRGDYFHRVFENKQRFFEACGIMDCEAVHGKQVHGNRVLIVGQSDLQKRKAGSSLEEADGFVTNVPGVPLMVFTADCVPVLLEDPVHRVVGAVHSGWRSTVADIEGSAIEQMVKLGADPRDIRVAIGPAIDKCCFEVGEEVIQAVEKLLSGTDRDSAAAGFYVRKGDKYMLDLRGVVRERLIQLGASEAHIELVGGCTMCHPDRYWSHRYTKGERGSQASVIMQL